MFLLILLFCSRVLSGSTSPWRMSCYRTCKGTQPLTSTCFCSLIFHYNILLHPPNNDDYYLEFRKHTKFLPSFLLFFPLLFFLSFFLSFFPSFFLFLSFFHLSLLLVTCFLFLECISLTLLPVGITHIYFLHHSFSDYSFLLTLNSQVLYL